MRKFILICTNCSATEETRMLGTVTNFGGSIAFKIQCRKCGTVEEISAKGDTKFQNLYKEYFNSLSENP